MNELFHRIAVRVSGLMGSPYAFLLSILVIIGWALSGPVFNFSDTWQLVVNTGTTIVTFLMVFLIQNTQNRDAKAVHLKLNELLRSTTHARDGLIDLEELTDQELMELDNDFRKLHETNYSTIAKLLHEKVGKVHTVRKANQ